MNKHGANLNYFNERNNQSSIRLWTIHEIQSSHDVPAIRVGMTVQPSHFIFSEI